MSNTINGYKISIYPEGNGYTGCVYLPDHPDGRRNRPKRKGPTKTAVHDKLEKLIEDLQKGIKASKDDTVLRIVTDFVDLQERRGLARSTIRNYRKYQRNQITIIGHHKVKDLTVRIVTEWLTKISAKLSTGPLRSVHGLLSRALDYAMRLDLVGRNVSRMAELIKGQKDGRESKSFTKDQVDAIFAAAPRHRFGAYLVLGITSGLRVDELDALTWADLDLESGTPTVSVIRGDRSSGDVKTEGSKRALELADIAIAMLTVHRERQREEFAVLGLIWTPHTRVFTQEDGSPYWNKPARRDFRKVLRVAGIDGPEEWTPRETRTTFVSIMSDAGVPAEQIADMCGHTIKVLFKCYRKQLKPVQRKSASVINNVFGLAA